MKKVVKQFFAAMLVLISVICLWQPTEAQAASKKKPVLSSKTITLEPVKSRLLPDRESAPYWYAFSIKVINANANVKWSYDENYIKCTTETGAVAEFKPIKAGTTTIKCKVGKKTLSCKVNIKSKTSEAKYSIKSKKIGKNIIKVTIKNKSKLPIEGHAILDIYDSEWKAAGSKDSEYVYILPDQQKEVYITGIKDWNYEKPYADMSVYTRKDLLAAEKMVAVDDSNIEYSEEIGWFGRKYLKGSIKNKSNLPIEADYSILAYKNEKLYAVIHSRMDTSYAAKTQEDFIISKEEFETTSGEPFNAEGVTYKFHLNYAKYNESKY